MQNTVSTFTALRSSERILQIDQEIDEGYGVTLFLTHDVYYVRCAHCCIVNLINFRFSIVVFTISY